MESLPSFRRPPVVETALSVQFQILERFGNAHLGLFWQLVREDFPERHDADPIEPQLERFGDARELSRLPQLRLVTSHQGARLRMSSADGHEMLQLQNGRLVYNWRRLENGEYPRWRNVKPVFLSALGKFQSFLESESIDELRPQQWEVTYVNYFERGREWESPCDWPALLPSLLGHADRVSVASFESLGYRSSFVIPEQAGRLHVELNHGLSGPETDSKELLIMKLTARGEITEIEQMESRLSLGRNTIVGAFGEMTGDCAQQLWERE